MTTKLYTSIGADELVGDTVRLCGIDDFEYGINDTILHRGRLYYEEGRVLSLERRTENTYRAMVAGSYDYCVDIEIGGEGRITDISCNCPYDDEYCKHEVAALYELREEYAMPKLAPTKDRIMHVISRLSRADLERMLMNLLEQLPGEEEKLLIQYGEGQLSEEQARSYMRERMQTAISQHSGNEYMAVRTAVDGIEYILECIEHQPITMESLRIYAAIVEEVEYFNENAFDHDGDTYHLADKAMDMMNEAAHLLMKDAEDDTKRSIFQIAFGTMKISHHYFSCDLEPLCIELTKIPACFSEMEQFYISKLTFAEKNRWNSSSLEDARKKLISFYEQTNAANKYEELDLRNLIYDGNREQALARAFEKGAYDLVIKYAKEGEREDAKNPTMVSKLRNCQIEAYMAKGDHQTAKKVVRQWLLDGDQNMCYPLFGFYSQGEWAEEVEILLDEIERQGPPWDAYEALLAMEHLDDKLFEHCKRFPERIFETYNAFSDDNHDKVDFLFTTALRDMAAMARNRKDYKQLCKYFIIFKDANYDAATALALRLRAEYKRRTSMIRLMDGVGL